MPRPESHIRPDDKYKVTRQKADKGGPHYSYVCRLKDNEGKEHTFSGWAKNPGQVVRFLRYALDNPPEIPTEEDNN